MPRFPTLLEMLQAGARDDADRVAVFWDGGTIRCAELFTASLRCADLLRHRAVGKGDRVVIAIPNGIDFLRAFFGVQLAGAVAVPIFPDSGAGRIVDLARLSEATAIVLPDSLPPQLSQLGTQKGFVLVQIGESDGRPAAADTAAADPEDLSFIQYTSGSTGNPKGVQLSHSNVLENLEQMIAGMGITAADTFLSWLPMHHDMGLVLMTLTPLYVGARLVLLPTSMASIRSWMQHMVDYDATFTAGPDFAYRLCLRTAKGPPAGVLRTLRVALNAAEPVRAQTIVDFDRRFGVSNTMVAGYGLAEATVGVSMWPPLTAPKVDERGLVSVGKPFPEVEVQITGEGRIFPSGEVGEIEVRSPATTRGYFGNPNATRDLHRQNGFVRTGDLGYKDADGDLFIVGRLEDTIIHGGYNLAPQEVEETVDRLPFVRRSAAIGIDRGRLEGQQVHVYVELNAAGISRDFADQARQVVRSFHERLGFRPARVYLLRPRAIPMTHNGKIRHSKLKQRLVDGSLRAEGAILFPDY